MHRILLPLILILLLAAGCADYDPRQAEQLEPLGTPPVVALVGESVTLEHPDSLHVQAHVLRGELEFSDYNFGCQDGGELVQTRVARVLADRIDLEATYYFSRRGTYWLWVHVWDTEEQTDTDSLRVVVR